jgi:Cof subfamily protein (haloacid dehalogenase superfamily)
MTLEAAFEPCHRDSVNRLFVSDLDGTLVGRNARLSYMTRRHLLDLLRGGLRFTVASARSIHTMAPILEGLPIALPVAEFNGAFITDLKHRQPLVCHALDAAVVEVVLDWALGSNVPPFVSSYSAGQQRLYPPVHMPNAGIRWYDASRRAARDPRLRAAVDPRSLLDQSIVCLTLIADRATLTPLLHAVNTRFPGGTNSLLFENPYQRGWYWLTVQSDKATKAHALRAIAAHAGIELEQSTVFGDEINDIPMFEVAGRGVAVENAVAELRQIAHEVIGHHEHDSVIRYLLACA